jgi:hypothetical protein
MDTTFAPGWGRSAANLTGRSGALLTGHADGLQSSRHGPQLTVSMLGLYMRATHQLGVHTDLSIGLYLGPVLAWIQSR